MAVDPTIDKEKLAARQKLAADIDRYLGHSMDSLTPEEFESDNKYNPDYEKAGLSEKEVSDYITRRTRQNLAREIKSSDDPLGYVQGMRGNDSDELPGGVSREQAARFAKLVKSRQRESDKLSAKDLELSGYRGLSELREMQERRERGEGFKGMGKGTQLTTPAQKMRRAARMAERRGNSQEAQRLFKDASDIDPEITTFFKSPQAREVEKSLQREKIKEIALRRDR